MLNKEENNKIFVKKFFNFKESFDFNTISNLLDNNNFKSIISSNWLDTFVFESVFQIINVEKDIYFSKIFETLNEKCNKKNKKTDLSLFFSLVSGNKSISHKDNYDVYIIGMYGQTLYKVNDTQFIVEKGDILYISKNSLHKAIGITPRICLSYGVYD